MKPNQHLPYIYATLITIVVTFFLIYFLGETVALLIKLIKQAILYCAT